MQSGNWGHDHGTCERHSPVIFMTFLVAVVIVSCGLFVTINFSKTPSMHRMKRHIGDFFSFDGARQEMDSADSVTISKEEQDGIFRLKKKLLTAEVNCFEDKHLLPGILDSFQHFTRNPAAAKQHVLNLNQMSFLGEVLPAETESENPTAFAQWVATLEQRSIVSIDANMSTLQADIRERYHAWKSGIDTDGSGNLVDTAGGPLLLSNMPMIYTEGRYNVTLLTFDWHQEKHTNIGRVTLNMSQLESELKFLPDYLGNPSTFAGLGHDNETTHTRPSIHVASFDRHELSIIAQVTRDLWRSTGNEKKVLLNGENPTFRNLKTVADNEYLKQLAGRRNTGGVLSTASGVCTKGAFGIARPPGQGCAITVKSNGMVESILPLQFIHAYSRDWSEEQKEEMVKTAKRYQETVVHDGYADILQNLIEWEEAKRHVATVATAEKGEKLTNQLVRLAGDAAQSQAMLILDNWVSLLGSEDSPTVKLSGCKLAHGFARAVKSVALDKNGESYLPRELLAKILLNGIIEGDRDTLVTLGNRLDVGDQPATLSDYLDGKYFAKALKWGKAVVTLAKVSGAIGAERDLGLSVWGFIKAVERLTNSSRQSDSIANLIGDSKELTDWMPKTEIRTEIRPGTPSHISAKAQPDLEILQETENFRARTEWSRIDTQIPLADYTKSKVFEGTFDWMGERKRNYTYRMLGDKASCTTNRCQWEQLRKNPLFAGIVFPPGMEEMSGGWGVGGSRSDSIVDFGEEQKVYLERALSEDLASAVFKCKPSTEHFVDASVSQRNRKMAYLCENAIALEQPNFRRLENGQVWVFDLGDGDDTVIIGNNSAQNLFLMGNDGHKEFYGGTGKDEFLFDVNCTATLRGDFHGGSGEDRLSLGDSCASGEEIQINLRRGILSSSGRNLNLHFSDIEELIGRSKARDVVEVALSTKWVFTKGGASSGQPDEIRISDGGLPLAALNLTVLATSHMKITSSVTKGLITLPVISPWNGLQVDAVLDPRSLQLHVTFLNTSASQITGWLQQRDSRGRMLGITLSAGDENGQFNFIKARSLDNRPLTFPMYFTENGNGVPDSVLLLNDKSGTSPVFYHHVPQENQSLERKGCQMMENVFNIQGQDARLTGGDNGDEFILHTSNVGRIDGGDGTDILMLHPTIAESLSVDLASEKFKSIENVRGVPGIPLIVDTACDTELVAGQGGSEEEPDTVRVTPCTGGEMLRIVAEGKTNVKVAGEKEEEENRVVLVLADGASQENKELNFELETKSAMVENLLVAILTQNKNWTALNQRLDQDSVIVELEGNGMSGRRDAVQLTLKQNQNVSVESSYFQMPYIQMSVQGSADVPGILAFERNTGRVKVIHALEGADGPFPTAANGYAGLENIFRLATSGDKWAVRGGNLSDQFFLAATVQDGGQYSIHGGPSGQDNLLFVEVAGNRHQPFLINLVSHEIGYLGTPQERRGSVENIQHVVGRKNAPDVIHAKCDTKTINGRGGRGEGRQRDVVNVRSNRCYDKMTVTVGRFTTVNNSAVRGEFTYIMEDLVTTNLDLDAGRGNLHLVKILCHPWDYLRAVAFDGLSGLLRWRVSDGQQERVHSFKMSREAGAAEYNNPVFVFSPSGSGVESEIRVASDESTIATLNVLGVGNAERIYGLPVDFNRFLINIPALGSLGEIHGNPQGNRMGCNQFWIQRLDSPLALIDGGACQQNGCTNQLHLTPGISLRKLHVDMDINRGHIRTEDGQIVVAQLKNFHELHGASQMIAYVACDTTHVSDIEKVVLKAAGCPMQVVIGVEEYTQVWFHQENGPEINEGVTFPNSSVHYRFSRPMSFEPQGSHFAMLSHQHHYYLPFSLDMLSELHFNRKENKLCYVLLGREYHHTMITSPLFIEQFYSQPSMVTEDGYSIQVGRDGFIWTTLTSTEITYKDIPELQELANRLGVTVLISTSSDVFLIGHNSTRYHTDRNVLQNVAGKNVTSRLVGGGADDTIYEIQSLDSDVFIYTGYIADGFNDWLVSRNRSEQTIDLTSIVVPIRTRTGRKYVPSIRSVQNDLVIWMEGHEDSAAGRILIKNGAHPWVAKRVQLLLSSAIMDLVPATHWTVRNRWSKRSSEATQWKLHPRPVLISQDTAVYSLAPEDLEDGQDIQLDSRFTAGERDTTFSALRNGTDLYLTNILSPRQMERKTVVITDLFEPSPYLGFKNGQLNVPFRDFFRNGSYLRHLLDEDEMDLPRQLTRVTVHLPGLNIMIHDGQMKNMTSQTITPKYATGDQLPVLDWWQSLSRLEDELVERLPGVQRIFPARTNHWRIPQSQHRPHGPCCSNVHPIWFTRTNGG